MIASRVKRDAHSSSQPLHLSEGLSGGEADLSPSPQPNTHPLETFCTALMQTLHRIPAVLMVRMVYQVGQSYECCSDWALSSSPQPLRAALVSTLAASQPPQWRDPQPRDCVVTQAGSQLWVYHLLLTSTASVAVNTPSDGSLADGPLADNVVQVATRRLLDPSETQILKAQCQLLRVHLELYRSQHRQQATITLLEEVIRRISHQLFHPLATIRLCVENARWNLKGLRFPQTPDPRPDLCPEEADFVAHLWATQARAHQAAHQGVAEQINTIASTTDSLGSTLKRLVACARGTVLNLGRHELGSLLVESIDRLTPKAAHKQVRIQQQGSPAWAQVDPILLGQVLDNLLGNAIDFSPKGGLIECHCQSIQDQVLITIADQGSGLSAEAMKSAFNAFYSSRPQGTGLGLTIAQKIVSDHNGTIWAENHPQGGARFSVVLPSGS